MRFRSKAKAFFPMVTLLTQSHRSYSLVFAEDQQASVQRHSTSRRSIFGQRKSCGTVITTTSIQNKNYLKGRCNWSNCNEDGLCTKDKLILLDSVLFDTKRSLERLHQHSYLDYPLHYICMQHPARGLSTTRKWHTPKLFLHTDVPIQYLHNFQLSLIVQL